MTIILRQHRRPHQHDKGQNRRQLRRTTSDDESSSNGHPHEGADDGGADSHPHSAIHAGTLRAHQERLGGMNPASYYFDVVLEWKSVAIEANPNNYEKLEINRPNSTLFMGGFCDTSHMNFDKQKFYMQGGQYEVSFEVHAGNQLEISAVKTIPCLKMTDVFQKAEISRIDVFYITVKGDALAVIRAMEWRVRSDIWVVERDGKKPERDEKVMNVLLANEYVPAAWDIKRWCDPTIQNCMPIEVFLKKGFTPLPEEV